MKIWWAAFAAAMAFSAPASAAALIETYEFEADTGVGPTPIHTGSFTLSIDEAAMTVALVGIDYAIGSTVFTPATTGLIQHFGVSSLTIGGLPCAIDCVQGVTDDFRLSFVRGSLGNSLFMYSQQGFQGFGQANGPALSDIGSLSLTLTDSAPVPEPGIWAMLIAGFGVVGSALRRRRRLLPATV